jgi:uncharacterized protein involved in response to NO
MASTAARMRSYAGPAVLSYGFRPFFLLGALWAACVVAVWLPVLAGEIVLPTAFAPIEWHVHELVYGYVPAIVAGFLLTAVPNWTGRLPVTGLPLLLLVGLWAAGRLAVFFSSRIGAPLAAAVDLAFLACLALVIAREIVAGRNVRNAKVLALVALLWLGNAVFHWEAITGSGGGYGTRLGIGVTVLLIALIGGRIVPSFTRNWLVRQAPGRLPVPFGAFDVACLAASVPALAAWIAMPQDPVTALLAAVAAGCHAARLGRWAGHRTFAEPLVLVLHVGYACVPLGFALLALAIALPGVVAASGALHGWTVGAVGTMTLAVMTRASLGHTGRPLVATPPILFIYGAVILAAAARLAGAFGVGREGLLTLSAAAWVAAFAGFVVTFGPMLLTPRAEARAADSSSRPGALT